MGWSWDCMGISAMSGIVRFEGFAAVGGGGGGQSCGCLCGWRDGVSGPTAVPAQLPVIAAVGEGQSHVYTSPAATMFSGAAGLAAMVRGPGLQSPPVLFSWFYLLCLFQSTHL